MSKKGVLEMKRLDNFSIHIFSNLAIIIGNKTTIFILSILALCKDCTLDGLHILVPYSMWLSFNLFMSEYPFNHLDWNNETWYQPINNLHSAMHGTVPGELLDELVQIILLFLSRLLPVPAILFFFGYSWFLLHTLLIISSRKSAT